MDEYKDKVVVKDWICFLNENNQRQMAFVNLVKVDSFMIKFETADGNIVFIPSARMLKMKEGVR